MATALLPTFIAPTLLTVKTFTDLKQPSEKQHKFLMLEERPWHMSADEEEDCDAPLRIAAIFGMIQRKYLSVIQASYFEKDGNLKKGVGLFLFESPRVGKEVVEDIESLLPKGNIQVKYDEQIRSADGISDFVTSLFSQFPRSFKKVFQSEPEESKQKSKSQKKMDAELTVNELQSTLPGDDVEM